ncbi:MAG: patatin-like phospholipase family protein, partial [Pseudomonadales bacterium]
MAHLGVLQALDNAGIVVDAVSGTSAGAMVGTFYAAGVPPEEASEDFARDLQPSRVESRVPRGDVLYLLRKYRRNEWDGMLRPYLHDWQLQQLLTPVTTVSVDLVSGSQQAKDRGDAIQAILESINLPGLSPPICRDAMALVDGGVLNNVPADVLVNRGADFVIAVDVGSQLPHEFSRLRDDTPSKKVRPPNAFETL